MNQSDVHTILNSSISAYQRGDLAESRQLLSNLMKHDVRAVVGDSLYDIAMEIYVFVFSGDLTKEGRIGGFTSIEECKEALIANLKL
jgi:hypothetical protein